MPLHVLKIMIERTGWLKNQFTAGIPRRFRVALQAEIVIDKRQP